MTHFIPQHWLLFAGPSDTGLAVQLEPVMGKNGVSRSVTTGPVGESLDIELTTSENDNTPSTDAYHALEESAREGGRCGYTLLQSEGHLRNEATFRFQFEKQYLKGDVLHNVSGASADLLFGLAVVTAVLKNLEYRPFAATGILNKDGQVQPIEGLRAKIHAALDIPALSGNGLIFYPKANDKDIDAELRHQVEQAQITLKAVERLEEAVECLGIPIQGTWLGNPYRRLDVFESSHRRIYFGREDEADHLAKKLFERAKLGRPSLLILGPSGGGKSSLVQAGLIPELEKRFKDHTLSPLFSVFDLRSAANKDIHAIAASIRSSWSILPGLAALAVNSSSEQQTASTSSDPFAVLVSDLISYLPDQTCFVWVLDQLEQFFTLGLSEEAEAAFIHFLRELQAREIWIVATFRNDFYSALQAHDGILSIFDKDAIYDLEKLSETTIERIIQKPAELARLEFEKNDKKSELLSLKLKNDALGGGKDILPLLEFALDQLYQKRELKNGRTQLTWATYEAMGGLQGAIGNRADEVLQSLDESAQEAFGYVLRTLAKLRRDSVQTESGKSPFIASVADVEQFTSGTPARRLVDAFADARLFVLDRDNEGIAQVRVTHEALFTHWAKADKILKDSMKDMVVRERLADSEAHWKAENEAVSLLLQPGLPLEEAEDLLARLGDELHPDIIHYIKQSVIADQERKQKESEAQRRKNRFVSITAVVLGILLIVAVGAIYYVNQARKEQAQMLASAYFDEGAKLVDKGRTREALAYLASAMRLDSESDTVAARLGASLMLSSKKHINISTSRVLNTFGLSSDERLIISRNGGLIDILDVATGKPVSKLLYGGSISSAQFSPDGRRVVIASNDDHASIWDVATGKSVSKQMKHGGGVIYAQFSPDGRLVVTTATFDNSAKVWDAATGELVSKLESHKLAIKSAQFTPDGRWVIIVSNDDEARIWDAVIGEPVLKQLTHETSIKSIHFSPNARWVVTASDGTARVWDAVTEKPVSKPMMHGSDIKSVQFSPDGRWVVTASSETIQVWDAATGDSVSKSMRPDGSIRSVQFSPDGRWVVTASYKDTVQIWDAATGDSVSKLIVHGGYIQSVKFSPDGRRVVIASSDTIQVWDVAMRRYISKLELYGDSVKLAQFSSDGRWIVTVSENGVTRFWDAAKAAIALHPNEIRFVVNSISNGRWVAIASDDTVRIWDAVTEKPVSKPMVHGSDIKSIQFSPDGRWVVIALDDTVRVWDAATGEPVSKSMVHRNYIKSVQFSPDGRLVVTASDDKTARVWDVATGELVSESMVHRNYIKSIQFSPDGHWVVTASDDMVRVWNVTTRDSVSKLMKADGFISSVQFSPDGRWVVIASYKDTVAQVWDVATGESVSKPIVPMARSGYVKSVQFSPDGRWVVTALDDMVRVWDAATGDSVSKPMMHGSDIKSVQFSPDGRWVVTASNDTVRVWDVATGEPVSESMVHRKYIKSIQFNPEGRWIVTASGDIARVWDTATGDSVSKPMMHGSDISSAQFSPDGRWVVTASDDTVRVWESETGNLIFEPFIPLSPFEVDSAQFDPGGHNISITFKFPFFNSFVISREIPQFPEIGRGFTKFLDLVSGYSINNRKNILQAKYQDSTISELRDWMATATDLTGDERAFIDWWLCDPIERTVTPTSKQTVKERVQMLIDRDTLKSLNEALDYYPGHPLALTRLAAATWREAKSDQQNDIRPRVSLWANLALKYAPDDTAVRAVAEKVLQDIAQPN